jgi:predicted Zn-dependent protease
MYSNLKILMVLLGVVLASSCATPEVKPKLSLKEQIEVDTESARQLAADFEGRARFIELPRAQKFLLKTAVKLAQASKEFSLQSIEVRIHSDADPKFAGAFSFPGTLLSVPMGFLKKVEFENELAAYLSYELANVMNRHLAAHLENGGKSAPVILLGDGSVFQFDQVERASSIRLGTGMLYFAGYDPRGMASVFQRYPEHLGFPLSDSQKKEVEFNIREAQRSRNELLPSLKPIVRSAEFIQFKKELGRLPK